MKYFQVFEQDNVSVSSTDNLKEAQSQVNGEAGEKVKEYNKNDIPNEKQVLLSFN